MASIVDSYLDPHLFQGLPKFKKLDKFSDIFWTTIKTGKIAQGTIRTDFSKS